MKRFLQAVAAVVVGVLATQAALGALPCSMAARCAMSRSEMGPNCPMTHALMADACSPGCCDDKVPATNLSWAAIDKPSDHASTSTFLLHFATPRTASAVATLRSDPILLGSPPLYLVHRVFRI